MPLGGIMLEMAIVIAMLNDPHNPKASNEQECLIKNTIYESIGEGQKGMQLTTEVAINRLDVGYRGARSMCDVIHSPSQFSWTLSPDYGRYQYSEEEYLKAAQVVFSILYDEVERILPKDVLHYLNTETATDLSWYDKDKVVLVYGGHSFLDI